MCHRPSVLALERSFFTRALTRTSSPEDQGWPLTLPTQPANHPATQLPGEASLALLSPDWGLTDREHRLNWHASQAGLLGDGFEAVRIESQLLYGSGTEFDAGLARRWLDCQRPGC